MNDDRSSLLIGYHVLHHQIIIVFSANWLPILMRLVPVLEIAACILSSGAKASFTRLIPCSVWYKLQPGSFAIWETVMWLQLFKSILNLFCGGSQQVPTSTGAHGQHHTNDQWPSQQQHRPDGHAPASQWQNSSPVHIPSHSQIHSREQYVALRAQANEQGDLMAKAFKESHESYARGNGAEAKDFSNQGKEHQRKMQELNRLASDFIFTGQ